MIKVPIFFQLNKLGLVGAQKELRKLTNQTKAFGITSRLSIGAASVALTAYTKKSIAAAMALKSFIRICLSIPNKVLIVLYLS